VIVDELHHLSAMDGTYAKILSHVTAPVRLGFTATLPVKPEAKLAVEGFIGGVIGELSINEAADLDILARPKLRIVKLAESYSISEKRTYQDVYQYGIVMNEARNNLIIKIAKEYIEQYKSVLIMVNQLSHGEWLSHVANQSFDLDIPFVRGSTESFIREEIKRDLQNKRTLSAICSSVWKEGINIPSLDVVINAGGGKSEIAVLQAIGRGLRKTSDKKEVIIVDFFDPSHHYLISHFGHRLCLYCDNGWI